MHSHKNIFLLIIAGCSLLLLIVIDKYFCEEIKRSDFAAMTAATALSREWISIISKKKIETGAASAEVPGNDSVSIFLGEEYTSITTTLGHYEAKRISINPDFAGLIVRLINDADVSTGRPVGVVLSGSFPGLGISVLAALQTMNIPVILISSLGASSFGANQPAATWLDIERWLNESGELSVRSSLVTYGGEADTGGGMWDDGRLLLDSAAARNSVSIYHPPGLHDAIQKKISLLVEKNISLLINIGGSQAALGNCIHASTIPNGLQQHIPSCGDADRGLIIRMNERGIPVIHLLHIRGLALRYGISQAQSVPARKKLNLYYEEKPSIIPVFSSFCIILISLLAFKRKF